MRVGESIGRLRAEKRMSQEALAEKLGVSRQAVSSWETGASMPELDKLIKLREVFGVTLDELVSGERAAEEKTEKDGKDEWGDVFAALWRRVRRLYRERAYLLGWLLVAVGLARGVIFAQGVGSYWREMGREAGARFSDLNLCYELFIALHLLTGLLIVLWGRQYAGRFRWYHLGLGLLALGLFGLPPWMGNHLLLSGLLNSLLTDLLFYLRFYGPERLLEELALWPEDIACVLLCAAGGGLLLCGRSAVSRGSRRNRKI